MGFERFRVEIAFAGDLEDGVAGDWFFVGGVGEGFGEEFFGGEVGRLVRLFLTQIPSCSTDLLFLLPLTSCINARCSRKGTLQLRLLSHRST